MHCDAANDLMCLLKTTKHMKVPEKQRFIKAITLSEELKTNRGIAMEAVNIAGLAIMLFSEELKNDIDLAIAACGTNIGAISFAGDALRSDPAAGFRLVRALGTSVFSRLLLGARSNLDLCWHVIVERNDPFLLQNCPVGVTKNRDFIVKVIREKGLMLNLLEHFYDDVELQAISFSRRNMVYAEKVVNFVESDPARLTRLLEVRPRALQAFPAVKNDPANLELVLNALADGMEVWSDDPIFTIFPRNFQLWYLAILSNPHCMAVPASCYRREINAGGSEPMIQGINATYRDFFFKAIVAAPTSVNDLPQEFLREAEFMRRAIRKNWRLAFPARSHLTGHEMFWVFAQEDVNVTEANITRSEKMWLVTMEAKKIAQQCIEEQHPSFMLFLKATNPRMEEEAKRKKCEKSRALARLGGHGYHFKSKFLNLVHHFAGAPTAVEFKAAKTAMSAIKAAVVLVREAQKVRKEREFLEKYGIV